MEDSLAYLVNNTANISRALQDIASGIGILVIVVTILGIVHLAKDWLREEIKKDNK